MCCAFRLAFREPAGTRVVFLCEGDQHKAAPAIGGNLDGDLLIVFANLGKARKLLIDIPEDRLHIGFGGWAFDDDDELRLVR